MANSAALKRKKRENCSQEGRGPAKSLHDQADRPQPNRAQTIAE